MRAERPGEQQLHLSLAGGYTPVLQQAARPCYTTLTIKAALSKLLFSRMEHQLILHIVATALLRVVCRRQCVGR